MGIFSLICVICYGNTVFAQEKQSGVSILCLTENQEYNEDDLVELVEIMGKELELDYVQDLVIGTEVDCLNIDTQEIIKYIPILYKNECIFIAVIEHNGKLSISNDTEFYQAFLDNHNEDKTYLFYIEGNNIYAASNDETLLINTFSKEKSVSKFFHKYKYTEKIKYIKKEFECQLKKSVPSKNRITLSDKK